MLLLEKNRGTISVEDDHEFRETQFHLRDSLTSVPLLFSSITIRKYQVKVFQPRSFWCVRIRKCIIVRQTHRSFSYVSTACLDRVEVTTLFPVVPVF